MPKLQILESPLEYFIRRGVELGIDHATLRDKYLIKVGIPDYIRERHPTLTRLEGENTYSMLELTQNELQRFSEFYCGCHLLFKSKSNENGIFLHAGQGIDAVIIPSTSPLDVRSSQRKSFYFYLFGFSKRADVASSDNIINPDVELSVRREIIESSSLSDNPSIPKEFFQEGRSYKPAVDWMLLEYVRGLFQAQKPKG